MDEQVVRRKTGSGHFPSSYARAMTTVKYYRSVDGTICDGYIPTRIAAALKGEAMTKRTSENDMLDGIKSNIEATERHICRLKIEFSSFLKNGATGEQRRLTVQQLCTLENNLKLIKIRRMYASEATVQ